VRSGAFRDRHDAARQLAGALAAYAGRRALVLAVPRGAVPIGRVLADELDAELDIVLVRKLGAPGRPELAVGAVAESGWMHVAPHAAEVGATPAWLAAERERELERIRARRALYSAGRAALDPAGRIVIVVDDGLATGETLIASLHAVRARGPARLVCAVPVASPEGAARVAPLCDEFVCLATPAGFEAVGQYYESFEQVDDRTVIAELGAAPAARGPGVTR
jgi:predicted phosphoribosyltransferase